MKRVPLKKHISTPAGVVEVTMASAEEKQFLADQARGTAKTRARHAALAEQRRQIEAKLAAVGLTREDLAALLRE